MEATDGKTRETDVAATKGYFVLSNLYHHPRQNLSSNGWQKQDMKRCRKFKVGNES